MQQQRNENKPWRTEVHPKGYSQIFWRHLRGGFVFINHGEELQEEHEILSIGLRNVHVY